MAIMHVVIFAGQEIQKQISNIDWRLESGICARIFVFFSAVCNSPLVFDKPAFSRFSQLFQPRLVVHSFVKIVKRPVCVLSKTGMSYRRLVLYFLWKRMYTVGILRSTVFTTDTLYSNKSSRMPLIPCGKQHFREIATSDWVGDFTNRTYCWVWVNLRKVPTQSGVAISRKCCFPHGTHPLFRQSPFRRFHQTIKHGFDVNFNEIVEMKIV